MVELLLEEFVALFGKECPPLGEVFHFGIIIDVEVLGLEHVPLEISVLDFVAAKVEELRGRC
jgi:hypothetical protein